MKEELISIIIPVYKVERYINRCIDSVLNQTYKKLEIILVDDGSPDQCPKICDNYAKIDKRIKVIHKKNGGLSDARNAGINIANGKYISFIDSDDWVEKDYIQKMYDMLKKYNLQLVIGDVLVQYDSGLNIDYSKNKQYVISKEKEFEKMLYGIRDLDNGAWCKLYSKELFNKIRYPVGMLYEDTATTYKLIDQTKSIGICSFALYHYMKRVDSITECEFNEKKLTLIDVTEEMTRFLERKYPSLSNACIRKRTWSYLSTLSQLSYKKELTAREKMISNDLRTKALKNMKNIIYDSKAPLKDKIALICLKLDIGFIN